MNKVQFLNQVLVLRFGVIVILLVVTVAVLVYLGVDALKQQKNKSEEGQSNVQTEDQENENLTPEKKTHNVKEEILRFLPLAFVFLLLGGSELLKDKWIRDASLSQTQLSPKKIEKTSNGFIVIDDQERRFLVSDQVVEGITLFNSKYNAWYKQNESGDYDVWVLKVKHPAHIGP